jgi:hypothetical protein
LGVADWEEICAALLLVPTHFDEGVIENLSRAGFFGTGHADLTHHYLSKSEIKPIFLKFILT